MKDFRKHLSPEGFGTDSRTAEEHWAKIKQAWDQAGREAKAEAERIRTEHPSDEN